MAFSNVGTLSATPTHKVGSVNLSNLQDVYQFTVPGPPIGTININASIHDAVGNNPTITPTFRIFRDSNKDGKLTTSGPGADAFVAKVDSNSPLNEGPINFTTRRGSGTLFAVVDRPSAFLSTTDPVSTSYQMDLSATETTFASNLVPVKLPFGNLAQPNGFSGNISSSNTSDVFSFSLQPGQGTQIKLVGITADADIRVIKDNGDRIFQADELVTSSTRDGNSFESAVVKSPGDYLVQVYQSSGNTNYDLKLNPFNLSGSPSSLSSNSTPIVFASSAGGTLSGGNLGGILVGNEGKDKLLGHGGDDTLLGGANNDLLNGGEGNDRMFGGKGGDTLLGGADSDTFVLARQNGRDLVKGFQNGIDYIGLDKGLKFEDLTISLYKTGSLISAGKEELAFVQGVRPNQISANDFTQLDVAKLSANLAGLA